MPPPAAPAELLRALAEALAALPLQVSWCVVGAQAALIWGRPRLTADVDVTVRLEPEQPQLLVEALEARGFKLRVSPSDDFVRRTRVLPFVYAPNDLPLDVVLAGPGLEELFLSRAVLVEVGGVMVPVISPEDLIASKFLAGRARDLEDIRGILRERLALLDLESIRATLAVLEDALARSDLRPAFEAELARARRSSRP